MKITLLITIFCFCFLSQALAQAQETACNFGTDTAAYTKYSFKNRLATGESEATSQDAKNIAEKRMHDTAESSDLGVGIHPCGGTPQMVCSDTNEFPFGNGHSFYRVHIGFICPNDEGYMAEENQKYFEIHGAIKRKDWANYSNFEQTIIRHREKWLTEEDAFIDRREIKKQCGFILMPGDFAPKLQFSYRENPRNKDVYQGWTVRGLCLKPKSVRHHDPSPKPATDSPDPRINWLYQKSYSSKSFAVAKTKADASIAKRNSCRMRGGATEFKYTEKRNEFYWVSAKYRCRFD